MATEGECLKAAPLGHSGTCPGSCLLQRSGHARPRCRCDLGSL